MITQEVFDNNLSGILKVHPLKVVVAVSGGSDSMALTILTHNWAIKNGIELTALTVDHNLRKESKSEAETVHKWCEKYGIKHQILTYTGPIPTSNIEAVAREYRYKLLTDFMKKNSINYLFVAHNQDEQCETFFLNLSRGSGVYGLCGMPSISQRFDINIVRPMLLFTKSEIKEFLTSISQDWIEDPSNSDTKYKRVRIRNLKDITMPNNQGGLNRIEAISGLQPDPIERITLQNYDSNPLRTNAAQNQKSFLALTGNRLTANFNASSLDFKFNDGAGTVGMNPFFQAPATATKIFTA